MADSDAKGKGKARADDPQNPQLIRITNHGKITTWVAFALDFLDVSCSTRIACYFLSAIFQRE
jgi:hypothetical protein